MSHKKQVKLKNAGALYTMIGIGVVFLILLGLVLLSSPQAKDQSNAEADSASVSVQGDTQYIDITAKVGGYFPKVVNAKANMNTMLRVKTDKAYGCETAMTIPSLSISKNLPPTGTTEIQIPKDKTTKDLLITCIMRMYSATIKFS